MLKEFRHSLIKKLVEYGLSENESSAEIDFLLEGLFEINRQKIFLNPDIELTEEQISQAENIIRQRIQTHKPLQYLLNKAYFMGEKFYVDSNVLIPRPETELLVEKTIELASNFNNPKILDIGTGSGCIAIMIAKLLPDSNVIASDISAEALEVAKRNAKQIDISNIKFVQSDVFSQISDTFDIIISNPPYIPHSDKPNLQKEVILHEPHGALFADDAEGIEFYCQIIKEGTLRLKKGGYIAFELGINQSESVKKYFDSQGYKNIETIKDLSNIDRVICANI